MLAPVTHILPLTSIRRTRSLPVPGRVLVHPGQKVNPGDVIAQAIIPSGHMALDIRRGLGLASISAAESCIVRQPGEKLEKGDIVAESGGLFSRIIRVPVEGEVALINNGVVLLRTRTTQVEVKAGLIGSVVSLVEDRGAVLETNGALIQGMWGNGQIDSGLLLLVAKSPDEELTRSSIDVSMRGAVVLAGHCASEDALRAAGELPLRGLILASMTSQLLPVAARMNYPILVIEGFTRSPMNEIAYRLLTTSEKRDVAINAVMNPSAGERPELIIPLPANGPIAPDVDYFTANKTVRIQGAPYAGKVGTIVSLRQGLYILPNGLKAPAADVQLDKDTRVTVPLANLEVIV
jgi:hypothetical protein